MFHYQGFGCLKAIFVVAEVAICCTLFTNCCRLISRVKTVADCSQTVAICCKTPNLPVTFPDEFAAILFVVG